MRDKTLVGMCLCITLALFSPFPSSTPRIPLIPLPAVLQGGGGEDTGIRVEEGLVFT